MTQSHFFPFRALSSWPGVIHSIYDLESFLAFIALSSWPTVVYPIYDPESFILYPTQSRLSYFLPRVVHLVHELELFISSMTLSHSLHFFPSLCYSSHTFLSLLPFPHVELFHPCYCSPMFRPYSRHVLRQNLWSFFSSSIQFTLLHSLFVFFTHIPYTRDLYRRGAYL